MPWKASTPISLRDEFVQAAAAGTLPVAALRRQYQNSRKTGYKWLARFAQEGAAGLGDRSRRHAAHFAASLRPYPERLPPLVYAEGTCVRTIDAAGRLVDWWAGSSWRPAAPAGKPQSTSPPVHQSTSPPVHQHPTRGRARTPPAAGARCAPR